MKVVTFLGTLAGCNFAPFLAPLLGVHLIFEVFEPAANTLAPFLATITFLLTCVLFRGVKELAAKKIVASVSIAISFAFFLACLVLNLTVDEIWAPGIFTPLVQGVWFVAYEAMFFYLSMCVACIFLLQPDTPKPSNHNGGTASLTDDSPGPLK